MEHGEPGLALRVEPAGSDPLEAARRGLAAVLGVHVEQLRHGRRWRLGGGAHAGQPLGAMVAYRGDLRFVRERAFEGGFGKFVKKAVSGEASALTKVEGTGIVYLADQKKNITILRLQPGDVINVNGNDLLAFEDSVAYDITMHRRAAGMMSGGLFSVRLSGSGTSL